jgi:eukaryotic-like serine/threonine-protein kinase
VAGIGHTEWVVETIAGRYRLVERLGAGGMSVVWRGYDEVLGRPVAVKLLAPQWTTDEDFRGRVRREARAAARLSHPHITNVYDYGEAEDGTPYVVMELVDGQSLAHRLAAGPLAWRSAARVAAQVAAALAAAHAQGIVHRDVTPANVMLSRAGVKVVDFGIAAVAGERDREVLGTPTYLSPEQRAGAPAQPATDVYALGLLLYHCATGQAPRQVNLGRLPSELASVIRACLATDPAARPGSAVLARRLGELAGDYPVVSVPAAPPPVAPRPVGTRVMPAPPAWIPRRPRRLPWAFSGLVLLVLTFLAGVLYAGAQHSRAQADPAPATTTHSPSPSPSPTIGCTVTYSITASLAGEFGAEVKIENSGPLNIDGWTLVFDLPDDQTLRFGWAGRWQQDDRTVTVKDAVYNRSLSPGKSVTIGFAGSHGGDAKPKRFTVNGKRCITAS